MSAAVRWVALGTLAVFVLAATGMVAHARRAPMPAVDHVDLQRFMGDWYVIAHVPSRPERNAWNAIEHYALADDGTITTTFRFRRGAADADLETMHARGYVRAGTGNARWGMQFVWPIRAEYVINELDADYRFVLVTRTARDYAWIMARTPELPAADYERLVAKLGALGYDTSAVRRVPQVWPEPGGRP
jgi:apolipoprotein D and lipocalin family protein